MEWKEVREISEPMNADVAVLGFPGMANVGEQVITYLIKSLDPTPVAKIYSEYLMFPNNMVGISVLEEGRFALPSVSIFESKNPPLALVTSDVQPVPWGGMEIANEILRVLGRMGVTKAIVVTGFVDESYAGKVLAFGEDGDLLGRFKDAGAVSESLIKSVIGLAGSVLGMAKIRGLGSVVLSGVAPDYSPDPKAAKAVLEILDRVFSLGLDFKMIDRQIEEVERIKSELVKEIERRIREELGGHGEMDESTEYFG